jgi:hypothetical protein
MSSPGDNMAQMEPEDEYEGTPIIGPISGFEVFELTRCVNCTHRRYAHYDRAGCTEISTDANPEVNSFPRCHCTNFEAVKE